MDTPLTPEQKKLIQDIVMDRLMPARLPGVVEYLQSSTAVTPPLLRIRESK